MSVQKFALNLINKGKLNDPLILLPKNQVTFNDPIQGIVACLIMCKKHTSTFYAKQMNIPVSDIEFHDVTAEFNIEGFMGVENQSSKINWVKGEIHVKSEASEEDFEKLKNVTEKTCPVYNMLHRGGVDIDLKWKKI